MRIVILNAPRSTVQPFSIRAAIINSGILQGAQGRIWGKGGGVIIDVPVSIALSYVLCTMYYFYDLSSNKASPN
jgi:hypothetical protein